MSGSPVGTRHPNPGPGVYSATALYTELAPIPEPGQELSKATEAGVFGHVCLQSAMHMLGAVHIALEPLSYPLWPFTPLLGTGQSRDSGQSSTLGCV